MSDNRDYPARPILAASMAVYRPDGTVLLGARRAGPYSGVFSLPGGLVETGETLEEAALRELAEETAVLGEIVAFNGWREVISREDDGRVKRHYVIASFAARWLSGDGVPGEELGQLVWANEARIAELPLTTGLADLLARGRALALGK